MQFNWLKGFRCLLIGKLVDGATEQKLTAIINQFFADNKRYFKVIWINYELIIYF